MSIIAWDGTTLAADKRMVNYSVISTVTKVFRVGDDILVGFTGLAAQMGRYLAWMRAGFDPATYPVQDKDDTCYALVVHRSGRVMHYGATGYPVLGEDARHAAGSGRDFALAAMYLGCDAVRAVEITTHFCCDCGNGIDTLTFDAAPESRP